MFRLIVSIVVLLLTSPSGAMLGPISTNMVRLRGRYCAWRQVGRQRSLLEKRKRITFVAPLRHNKMTAPMVIE